MATNDLKHVGKTIDTDRRVIVVFREVPGEEDKCLVVDTMSLDGLIHDDIVSTVESQPGQQSANFYEAASRTLLTDGRNMLTTMHSAGLLSKQSTSNIMMMQGSATIVLSELNALIAEQTNNAPVVASPDGTKTTSAGVGGADDIDNVINDTQLAKNMMGQAIQYESEAKALRAQAIELDPSLKPKRGRPAKTEVETVD